MTDRCLVLVIWRCPLSRVINPFIFGSGSAGFGDELLLFRGISGVTNKGSLLSRNATYLGGMGVTADTGSGGSVAYLLDGTDDGLSFSQVGVGAGDFTVAAWFKLASKPSFAPLFVENSGTGPGAHSIQIDYHGASDRIRFGLFAGNSYVSAVATSFGSPTIGIWYLAIADFTFSTKQMRLMVNGLANTSTFPSAQTNAVTNATCGIGFHPRYIRFFPGLIDDVRYFGRLLTATEKSDWLSAGRGYDA